MPIDYPDFFNGERRPRWAGPVSISSQNFGQARSFSDRRAVQPTGKLGRRPLIVSGVVVPVSSSGRRKAIAVQQRDLRYTVQDVGHLFALSSGGPETDVQYVPQHASINRATLLTGGEKQNEQLNWRQLECYAQYVAQRGFEAGAKPPQRGESVHIVTGSAGDNGGFCIYVNGTKLQFPTTSAYAPRGNRGRPPRFMIRWSVIVTYPPSRSLVLPRGNDPVMLSVSLSWARSGTGPWTEFCKINFRNSAKYGKELKALMRPDRNRRNRIAMKRGARAYALAHPRRSSRLGT